MSFKHPHHTLADFTQAPAPRPSLAQSTQQVYNHWQAPTISRVPLVGTTDWFEASGVFQRMRLPEPPERQLSSFVKGAVAGTVAGLAVRAAARRWGP